MRTIIGGLTTRDTNQSRKVYTCMAREAPYLQRINLTELCFKAPRMSEQPITFTEEEARPLIHPYNDTIVVDVQIVGRRVFWILVDNGSFADILFTSALNQMNLVRQDWSPSIHPSTALQAIPSMPKGSLLYLWSWGNNYISICN